MRKWLTAACALVAVLIAGRVAAQETRGTISGTVRDKDGVLPGANVTITNTGTNVSQQLVTNGSGYFEAPLLIAGAYEVSVELPNFKSFRQPASKSRRDERRQRPQHCDVARRGGSRG